MSAFSKRHYEAVARIIRANLQDPASMFSPEDYSNGGVQMVAEDFAVLFHADNPRFDRARFLKACGVLE